MCIFSLTNSAYYPCIPHCVRMREHVQKAEMLQVSGGELGLGMRGIVFPLAAGGRAYARPLSSRAAACSR